MINKSARQPLVNDQKYPNKKLFTHLARNLTRFTPLEAEILKLFIMSSRTFKQNYVSQGRIAEKFGVSREFVNRTIKKLYDAGYILKTFRGVKRTCIYDIPFFFKHLTMEMAKVLKIIGLCVFSVQMIFSSASYPPFTDSKVITQDKYIKRSNRVITIYNYLYLNNSLIKTHARHMPKTYTQEDCIPDDIQKLDSLKLTWDQKFKLIAYPLEARSHAFSIMRGRSTNEYGTAYSFNWFKHLCQEYCDKNGIQPHWRIYYILQQEFNTKETQKGETVMKELPAPRVAYSYKLPVSYLSLSNENPLYIFDKQYKFMLSQLGHPVISPQALFNLGVANMVRPSFLGYCGELHPDNVLAHIDSLVESPLYRDIVNNYGLEQAKKFIELCIEAVVGEQEYVLNKNKMHYYGRGGLSKPDSSTIVLNDHIIYRTRNVDEFLRSDNYAYIADIVGPDLMKKYVYQLVDNWIKLVQ